MFHILFLNLKTLFAILSLVFSVNKCWSDERLHIFQNFADNLSQNRKFEKFFPQQLQSIGFGTTNELNYYQIQIYPTIDWENNINGGNPKKNLIINDQIFESDEKLYRKSGLLIGFQPSINGKYIFGNGRYLTYELTGQIQNNPQHNIWVRSLSGNLCSKNHVSDFYYLDFCVNSQEIEKQISDDKRVKSTIQLAKFFKSKSNFYNKVGISTHLVETKTYLQNQYQFDWEGNLSRSLFASLGLNIGNAVPNKLTDRTNVSVGLGYVLNSKPLEIQFNSIKSDGGYILGYDRVETRYSVNLSYPIWKGLSASIGYNKTFSNIDFFDTSDPNFRFYFNPINF